MPAEGFDQVSKYDNFILLLRVSHLTLLIRSIRELRERVANLLINSGEAMSRKNGAIPSDWVSLVSQIVTCFFPMPKYVTSIARYLR